MAENSPEAPQVKPNSWQQMHDGLFWPRYAPLLPVPRPYGAHEMIAAVIVLERLVEHLWPLPERPE